MTLLRFYLRTALAQLRRGEQRVLVALLCVAFGVMSLVAMALVSQSIATAVVLQPANQVGGDLAIGRQDSDFIPATALAQLQDLRASGALTRYTLLAQTGTLIFHKPDSGEVIYAPNGFGVDPAVYPLAGQLTLSQPAGQAAAAHLQGPGDVLVTKDLADQNDLHVGDAMILADLRTGTPVTAHIRGILATRPTTRAARSITRSPRPSCWPASRTRPTWRCCWRPIPPAWAPRWRPPAGMSTRLRRPPPTTNRPVASSICC